MTQEIAGYALRAYALFYTQYGATAPFNQSVLDWITSQSMKKKIFAVLLKAGWLTKKSREMYLCVSPGAAIKGLLEFKVPELMRQAQKPYAFTGLSAVEIWSDYCYVQRGRERSPYFLEVLPMDMPYWKKLFAEHSVPFYVNSGSTIGEFVILVPVKKITAVEKENVMVVPLPMAMNIARENEMYTYAYQYMRQKYGSARERRGNL